MSAGVVSHVAGGIGHFGRYVENRVGTVGAASLGDWSLEVAYGDIRGLNVLFHRLKQWIKVEGSAIRGTGVGTAETVPQALVEQQVAIHQHGDAVGIRAIRRIAVMLRHRLRNGSGFVQRRIGNRAGPGRDTSFASLCMATNHAPAPKPRPRRQRAPQSAQCDRYSMTMNDAGLDR